MESVKAPVLTKLMTCVASPVIVPAQSDATLLATVSVEAVVEEFVTMPPVPGRTPTLVKLPVVCVLPFRSSVPPAFTVSALAFSVEMSEEIVGPVVAR